MRRVRSERNQRLTRAPTSRSFGREYALREKLSDSERVNQILRDALAEIIEWYDTFDGPFASATWLTERDFERFRHLAKCLPRSR